MKLIFLILSVVLVVLSLGCAPESSKNNSNSSSDSDYSDSGNPPTVDPPVQEDPSPPPAPDNTDAQIEKTLFNFFGISLKVGDSWICQKGRCQKTEEERCSFSTAKKERRVEGTYNTVVALNKITIIKSQSCLFTQTNLSESMDLPGPGDQWGRQKFLIRCSGNAPNNAPGIFYVFSGEKKKYTGVHDFAKFKWINKKWIPSYFTPGLKELTRKEMGCL